MLLNTDYLFDFNKTRYKEIYEFSLPQREDLSAHCYEDAVILPARADGKTLFGRGGVIYQNQYIATSGIVSYGRDLLHRYGTPTEVFGGYYDFKIEKTIDEPVIYCGMITNHWGHFLVDFTTRLWYALSNDKGIKIVFVVRENQHIDLISNIKRFLELLGYKSEQILLINKPTKFKTVILPECSYVTNKYFSKKFLDVFDAVAENVSTLSSHTFKKDFPNNVYFARNKWHKAKSSEFGEEILTDFFRRNNFAILSPEKYTLDEQIHIIRNSKIIASIEGTIPHNMLFAHKGQKLLIINKTYNINSMQRDVNIMKNLDVTFVDAYVSIFPVPMGDGPFVVVYNNQLKKYANDNNLTEPQINYCSDSFQGKNIRKMIGIVREEISKSKINLNYILDNGNSAFFDPNHLLIYYSNYYIWTEKIKFTEKAHGYILSIKRKLGKIKYRLYDKFRKFK